MSAVCPACYGPTVADHHLCVACTAEVTPSIPRPPLRPDQPPPRLPLREWLVERLTAGPATITELTLDRPESGGTVREYLHQLKRAGLVTADRANPAHRWHLEAP